MQDLEITKRLHSIVLRGHFNPSIFQPSWFALHDLIRKGEAEDAKVEIIIPDLCIFETVGLRIEAGRDAFSVHSVTQGHEEILRDLVLGCFKLLRHTPVTMLGINMTFHLTAESLEQWHSFGYRFAPKEPWKDVFDEPEGLMRLVVKTPRDGKKRFTRVEIGPSPEPDLRDRGICITVNNHFSVEEAADIATVDKIMELLDSEWSQSLKRSEDIVNKLRRSP